MIAQITALSRRVPSWLIRDILIPFLFTRVGLCLVAWLGFHLWRPATIFSNSWQIDRDGNRTAIATIAPSNPHPFINMWSRWDGGWYLEIARSGYSYQTGKPSSVAFFPLYPLLVRIIHALLHLPATDYWFVVIGILTSNVSLFVTLIYLYTLGRIDYADQISARSILYLLAFPTSFFLSSVYAESLFLALTVSAFFYARKSQWTPACLLASLSTLCRSQGILILLPLFTEYLQQRHFKLRQLRWNVLQFVLIPLPLILFALYLHVSFGNWRIIFDSQKPWGRQLMWPWDSLSWILHRSLALSPDHHDWLDFSFFCLLAAAAVIALFKLRLSYTVYLWVAVLFFLSWGMLGSMPRFDLAIFPLFIVLALLAEKSADFHVGYLIIASLVAGLFMVVYSHWNWIA